MLRAQWKNKQHARTNGQCKQSDGNTVNKKRNASDKNIATEMKHAFDGLTRLDTAVELTWELESILFDTSQTKKQSEQTLKKVEQYIQGLQDNYKRCNVHIMGTTEWEEREKGTEEKLETMTEKNSTKFKNYKN